MLTTEVYSIENVSHKTICDKNILKLVKDTMGALYPLRR